MRMMWRNLSSCHSGNAALWEEEEVNTACEGQACLIMVNKYNKLRKRVWVPR
jgi:hypothetical protein